MEPALSRTILEQLVSKQGLLLLGIVSLRVDEDYKRFRVWVDEGKHAGMSFLDRHHEVRADPRLLLPSAKQALIIGFPYQQSETMRDFRAKENPWIAQYARFRDYHKTFRKKSEQIMTDLREEIAREFEFRICVDSAPLLERALATKSARGFIGKNSLFIHPQMGSFLLLAEILVDLNFPEDVRSSDFDPEQRSDEHGGCGTCRRCQVNCPTNALSVDYVVDARLCISYWTIEHRGLIPLTMWSHLKDYVFGCDICQLVCPYNRRDLEAPELPQLAKEYDLAFLVGLDEQGYLAAFAGTPVIRAKFDGLRRNALIAMAVSEHPALAASVRRLRDDPSEVIRGTCHQIIDNGYLG